MDAANRIATLRNLLLEIEADQAQRELEHTELVRLRVENLWLREALWLYAKRSSWALRRSGRQGSPPPAYEWGGGDEPWAAAEDALGL